MASTLFQNNIGLMDFSFKSKEDEGGVVLTEKFELINNSFSPQELFALETAKNKFGADAVYFRYFNDGRGAVPQIYIYDNTGNLLTENEKKNIHIKVWSGCQVPMFIIIEKTEVKIFDAREKVKQDIENRAFKTIELIGTVIQEFSAKSFDDGLFWEEKSNEQHFQFGTSAYKDLINGLKNVYNDFERNSGLNSHVALKLLVQCLLIKYLEERDEQSESGYFAKTYFKRNFNCHNFCEVIRNNKLLNLLDKLAEDFNGKIFEWSKDSEKEERTVIQKSKVQKLANYLDGNIQNEQFVLWRLYSFSHLPIELISSVYEELLTNSKDIVYTPEMIVSTLVDECMPLKSPQKNFKIIDVSCGSGIFLVKAYKRIIQWWRYVKWQETGQLIKPSLGTLKQLLTNSIYGRDIEGDAIRLSVFSLALALLDEVDLDPPTWQKLKFPDLGEKNIVESDFFEFITNQPSEDFDLVIGNPPFNLPVVNGKEPDRKTHFKSLENKYGYKSQIKIPDNNPALHFLVQAIKLLKPEAMLCLIQPSGPLLYQKDIEFKKAVFSQNNLLQIIDFTKLADVLWGKRNIATAAVFLQKSFPNNEEVVHVIANRTFSNVNKLFLELDHYDFHVIIKESILSNPNIWKSNLLGGGRIVELIDKLSSLRTLRDFLEEKESKCGWKKGEGFIENSKGLPLEYITNKDFVPTDAFTEFGIDWLKVHPCRVQKFHRKTNKLVFLPPHLLIRKILSPSKLITSFTDKYLVFKSDIVSIHAPEADRDELMALAYYLESNSTLLRFYILATSSRAKVNKATSLYDEDIFNLPYSERSADVKLSKTEQVLVNDALTYIFPSDSTKILNEDANESHIKAFSKLFCQTLNSIYNVGSKGFCLFKILDAGKYFALHFEYTDKNYKVVLDETTDLEDYIRQIIPIEKVKGKSTHIQKVLKIYGKDTIILTKPKQLRYWLQSIALRDADETFADYIKARYH